MAKLNELAFDLANSDREDEIYHTSSARSFIEDYLMWAARIEADEMGINKRFLMAVHSATGSWWSWSKNFIGGFDSLDEAISAGIANARESGDKFVVALDVETDEMHHRDVPPLPLTPQ